MNPKEFIKNNQQVIVLTAGYLLVAAISFGLGGVIALKNNSVEATDQAPLLNNSQNLGSAQSSTDCQIKGNINSKGSKIYHIPGGAFYKQTNAEQCFTTEEQAKTAGFIKSSR